MDMLRPTECGTGDPGSASAWQCEELTAASVVCPFPARDALMDHLGLSDFGETRPDGTLNPVVTLEDGAELFRGVGGSEGGLIDEAGRDGGPIGLSGTKKADDLLEDEGDGGIWDKVSIVRSESEGLVLKGVVILVTSSCCAMKSKSSSWSSGSAAR